MRLSCKDADPLRDSRQAGVVRTQHGTKRKLKSKIASTCKDPHDSETRNMYMCSASVA